MTQPDKRFVTGGLLLGIGLGGFVDGIVLHQILQWHHMLSSTADYPATTIAGLEANTLADGLFHAFTWLATIAGVYLIFPAVRDRSSVSLTQLTGLLLVGWGGFNLVEGLVDHQALGVHHVHPSEAIGWDLGFLALGALLVAVGWLLASRGAQPSAQAAGQDREPHLVRRPSGTSLRQR